MLETSLESGLRRKDGRHEMSLSSLKRRLRALEARMDMVRTPEPLSATEIEVILQRAENGASLSQELPRIEAQGYVVGPNLVVGVQRGSVKVESYVGVDMNDAWKSSAETPFCPVTASLFSRLVSAETVWLKRRRLPSSRARRGGGCRVAFGRRHARPAGDVPRAHVESWRGAW